MIMEVKIMATKKKTPKLPTIKLPTARDKAKKAQDARLKAFGEALYRAAKRI